MQPQLAVSANSIAAKAALNEAPATATVAVSVLAPGLSTYYLSSTNTSAGISSVSSLTGANLLSLAIVFKTPTILGAGTYSDTITVKGCVDQACGQPLAGSPQVIAVSYTVTPPRPKISSLSPASLDASGTAFKLTVNGSSFNSQSTVLWNGSARPTTLVSSTVLTAQISAADIAVAGTVPLVVRNVADGSLNSTGSTFTVVPLGPLATTKLSPGNVTVNGTTFNVTVVGSGFTSGSIVSWNGMPLPTTYISGKAIRGLVDATLVATVGSGTVTVANSSSQSSPTAPLTVQIVAPSISAVSMQMNAANTGAVNFRSVSLPAGKLWSTTVSGPASYALIADGRIFITSGDYNTPAQLVALNPANGSILWGPIAVAGLANAAYDAGTLFVTSGGVSSEILTAIDPATGNTKWTANVSAGDYPTPPVATNGVVYVLTNGELMAYDETTGASLWNGYAQGGGFGTVAVSADGVYTSTPCNTFDFNPLLGSVLWSQSTGCIGGGGDTPSVADGAVYSPNASSAGGAIYDSQSGSTLGTYGAPSPPALTKAVAFVPYYSAIAPYYRSLHALQRSNSQVLWNFDGDAALAGSPIVVNNYVFVGSRLGHLYALDATTGTQLWSQNLGTAIRASDSGTVSIYSGLAAGEGLLVVPAGNTVYAYLLSSNP